MSDAFDVLAADTTPVQPDRRFAAELRQRLITTLEEPMTATETGTTTGTTPAAAQTVTAYLCVDGAAAAIDFYVAAFGAVEEQRLVGDDGRVGHAEIVIGNTRLQLADEHPEFGVLAPTTRGGTSTSFSLEVDDVDAVFARALGLGAVEVRPVEDQFYGHRRGTLADPFGHQWSISTPIPGFSDETFLANSNELGYTVDRPARAGTDSATGGEHQVKHHVRGDVYYFTLPTVDLARAQAFFGAVLGWQFESPDNGHVSNITAPPGGPNQSDDVGARLWFVVDDIHAAVATVRSLGGTATDPVDYDSGWSSDCTDDQGTVFSLSVPAAKYTR